MKSMSHQRYFAPGFSLIEVLIALLVLGVGLLGMASLQIIGVRNTYESTLRSLAVNQCYEIADRMRANIPGVRAGGYNNITGSEADPSCSATCTATQAATYDAYQWNLRNAALLPSGAGYVCGPGVTCTVPASSLPSPNPAGPITSPNCGIYTITVQWVERENGVPTTQTFTSRMQPCSS